MATIDIPPVQERLPTHLELPEKDGNVTINFAEPFQRDLLTWSVMPLLNRLYPNNQCIVGGDSLIYWRLTTPPTQGAKAPDWFYVPNVPGMLEGTFRRSYVLWQEHVIPPIAIEFVSGDGSEEHDRTPLTGKFWVYEQGIGIPCYVIHDHLRDHLEMFQLVGGRYEPVAPNERGHFPFPPLGLELGIWRGWHGYNNLPWVRWWDVQGNLLPYPTELAEHEQRRADQEHQRAERLAERLRALGVDPDKEEGG